MTLRKETKEFLSYLQKNPKVRSDIRASTDKTLLYAGKFFKPVWKEIADLKKNNPAVADKEILPDVLSKITAHGTPYSTLLQYTEETTNKIPWKDNGFIIWRALSGIFAANASGKVSFYVGSDVKSVNSTNTLEERRVFAVTEIGVLLRNDKVDPLTKDIIHYFSRCIAAKNSEMNFGFIAG